MVNTMKAFIVAGAVAMVAVGAPARASTVYWQDSFESGDFSNWSFAQGADTSQGGPGPEYCFVTTKAKSLITPQNGTHYAWFERPASAVNNPHAKVFKEWTAVGKLDQLRRVESPIFNKGNVTATYNAWYYFPKGYTVTSDWVNIFQFKEEGSPTQGAAMVQNPSWWMNVGPQSSFANGRVAMETKNPVLFVNNWGNSYTNFTPKTMALPLGKWFEISARLYQGNRIDWYVGGKLFDTSLNSTYPVGRFFAQSTGWIWGVGHYGGIGGVYIDHCQVLSNP